MNITNIVVPCDQCQGLLTNVSYNTANCNLFFEIYCDNHKTDSVVISTSIANCSAYTINQTYDVYEICDNSSSGWNLIPTTRIEIPHSQADQAFLLLFVGSLLVIGFIIPNIIYAICWICYSKERLQKRVV